MDNVVVGHLCQDPILRQTQRTGRPMARFTVAVNRWRKVDDGFVERPPVFHKVMCFGPMAENVMHTLRKGMEVVAVGPWVDDSYSDEQGQRKVQVAMEAKAVGPTLRRATAVVSKVERPPEVRDDAETQARGRHELITEPARIPGLFDAQPRDRAPVLESVGSGGVLP